MQTFAKNINWNYKNNFRVITAAKAIVLWIILNCNIYVIYFIFILFPTSTALA